MLNPTGGLKFGERNYRGASLRGSSANPSAIVRGPCGRCGRVAGVSRLAAVAGVPCVACVSRVVVVVWLLSVVVGRRVAGVAFVWSACLLCRLCGPCRLPLVSPLVSPVWLLSSCGPCGRCLPSGRRGRCGFWVVGLSLVSPACLVCLFSPVARSLSQILWGSSPHTNFC